MNIQEAKEEIKRTVIAYTMKNNGDYVIAQSKQRPLLLIGPPGIGKTAIMEQVARECGIGIVAYTITHHTRQSAIGLPIIRERIYDGKKYSITEYTMSEIIASVYECIEKTGKKEGILFIDEINCASETLAPAMLQFLQNKTFGSHKVPEGWVITAAGNPSGYNKSVHEFDVVTLDRVRLLNIEEDFKVWKKYAGEAGVHEAVLSFLKLKPQDFYRMENTESRKEFVTARGWEDLSKMLYVYEKLGLSVDNGFVREFLQYNMIADDFTKYYNVYRKYKEKYNINSILKGDYTDDICKAALNAVYDEKKSLLYLVFRGLLSKLQNKSDDLYLSIENAFSFIEEICQDTSEKKIFIDEIMDSTEFIMYFNSEKHESFINMLNEISDSKKQTDYDEYSNRIMDIYYKNDIKYS